MSVIPADSQAPKKRLLRTRDVAEEYDVTPETVMEWARTGKLPSIRTPGGQYRFRSNDVEALLQGDDQPSAVTSSPGKESPWSA